MALYRQKYRIESARLKDWDYSSDGYYFITICTKNRVNYFGDIQNGIMGLNEIGLVTHNQWLRTMEIRDNVFLDEWVVMPNHFHGIVIIKNPPVETQCIASLRKMENTNYNKFGPQINNLASIIRGFKMSVTQYCRINGIDFAWQSRFYDRIIRHEKELNSIRDYIRGNPIKWE